MKKIAIIGAGNMGGALARALAAHDAADFEVRVSNPSASKLEALRRDHPSLHVTHDNCQAADGADIVVLAVKPWIVKEVIEDLCPLLERQRPVVVSIAAGIDLEALAELLSGISLPTAYAIPNTAITVGKGVTFLCHHGCDGEREQWLREMFAVCGEVAIVAPNRMDAGMALCSCGIAYVYKYVQASAQAGVQMGLYPSDALRYSIATLEGATAMLRRDGATPQGEIDRVTTPGGLTIRGVNELEHQGFPSALIRAILRPLQK